jgi:hypothetical protein
VLFVCSAGNDGMQMDGSIRWPSGLAQDDMITVGNLMNDGTTASSSNRVNTDPGEEFEVTLAAPGQEVVQGVDEDGNPVTDQTDIGNGHYFGGGTSAATPQVTAAAAIMMSLNPNLKPADIKRILSETARPGPANVGGKVLAIDQAVLEVINDMRERQGLPAVTGDELEKAGGIDAVATTTDEPDVYSVRGIVTMVPEGGMDIAISGSTGVTVEGAETTQAISDAGEVSWPVVTASIVDPEHPTTITVTRTDNGAASVITLEQIDLNGSWTGTYTITDITVDQDALSTLTSEESSSSDNLAEGCSGGAAMAAVLAVLDQLKGQPIPMTMDVTADMEAGTGQAVITLDPSGLDLGEGVTTGEPESTTIPFTFASPALTFQLPSSEGSTTSMTGTVSQKDDTFVIDGTMTSSGTGFSMTAVFKVTKPK